MFNDLLFLSSRRAPPCSTLFPYTTLFRSQADRRSLVVAEDEERAAVGAGAAVEGDAVADETGGELADAEVDVPPVLVRSEEHTSELQSRGQLVCRLLHENKKQQTRSKINQ